MLSGISQININNYNQINRRKSYISKNNPIFCGNSLDMPIVKYSDDVKTMSRRYNVLVLMLSGMVLGLSAIVLTGKGNNGLKIFKKQGKNCFEKLSDDIPTVGNCKSLQKDMEVFLKRQVELQKADKSIFSKIGGENKLTNRILLYGSPGTGKSYYGQIFAKSLGAEYSELIVSDVNSKWVGEFEENMRRIFENRIKTAKKNPDKKYVFVLNEIDAFITNPENYASSKSSHATSLTRQRSVFLNYLDRLKKEAPNIILFGTTNISPKGKRLDGASMSRFQKIIEVKYPESDALYEALKVNLKDLKNADIFISQKDAQLKEFSKQMAKREFSFRNMEYAVEEAKNFYIDDLLKKDCEFDMNYLSKGMEMIKFSDGELEKVA